MTLIHPLTSVRTTPPSSIREVPSPSIQDPLGEGVMVGMAPSVTCTRNEGGTDIVWVPGRRNAGHERSCGRYFSLSSERRHPCWVGSKTFYAIHNYPSCGARCRNLIEEVRAQGKMRESR